MRVLSFKKVLSAVRLVWQSRLVSMEIRSVHNGWNFYRSHVRLFFCNGNLDKHSPPPPSRYLLCACCSVIKLNLISVDLISSTLHSVAHNPSSAEILLFIIVNNLVSHLEALKWETIMTGMSKYCYFFIFTSSASNCLTCGTVLLYCIWKKWHYLH